jgi:hypothetical protein
MLQQLILSGRIEKWTYALIEYDLAYESLKYVKGQVVADFIVGQSIDQNSDESFNLVSIRPWKLFFDGSACREGQGIGVVLAEYEAILLGLQILSSMGIKHVKAFSDSLLVVQQVVGMFQCFNGSLNAYLNKCLEIIALFNYFTVHHVFRDENTVVKIWHSEHQVSNQIEENLGF